MDGLDSKEWKSVVLPKIYEEKMQKLEAELEKKVRVSQVCLKASLALPTVMNIYIVFFIDQYTA